MTTINGKEPRVFLEGMLGALFDPEADESAVGRYLTEDYTQYVDGKELDLDGFRRHTAAQRSAVTSVSFEVKEVVVDGDVVAERHLVRATKKDGGETVGEVHAFHYLSGGKVSRIVELTNMLSGDEGDEDLGSRE